MTRFELNEEDVRMNLAVAPSTRRNYEQMLKSFRSNVTTNFERYRECQRRLAGPSVSEELRLLAVDTRRQIREWIVADIRHVRLLERVLSER